MSAFSPLNISRTAAIFSVAAVLVSPPLTNVALAICLLVFVLSTEARARFFEALQQPIGLAALLMLASLVLGLAYGDAPWSHRLEELYHNRFWLLIPLFAALFGDTAAKRRLMLSWVLFCGVAAALSLAFWAFDYSPRHNPPGILLRDHVTQGMGLSLGAFAGVLLLTQQASDLSRHLRWLLIGAIGLSFFNVLQVSTGRSGHLALVVLAVFLGWRLFQQPRHRRLALGVAGLVLVGTLSSPMIRDRFALGLAESTSVSAQAEASSMGYRKVFWQNTIELVKARPWLGYGTGGFKAAYAEQVKGVEGWQGDATRDPHNQYLLTLAERGIPGLLALALFIALLLRQPNNGAVWRDMALGAILVWGVTNLVNSHFHTFNQGHLFAMYVGALLAPLAGNPSRADKTPPPAS